MVFPFLSEDCEVCLIIQAQATTFQLYKTFLELKVLCASRGQYLLSICIDFELDFFHISV